MVQKRTIRDYRKEYKRENRKIRFFGFLLGAVFCLAGFWDGAVYSSAAGTAADVLTVAASQIGYHEKATEEYLDDFTANSGTANFTKYARDLGVANGQPWCGYFVWWCMRTAGVPDDRHPCVGYVTKDWFVDRGLWHDRGTYVPKPGDYIAFGNPLHHCGIVESVLGDRVYTLEGNSSDVVKRRDYGLTEDRIAGYGTINYTGAPPVVTSPTAPPPAATKAPAIPSTDNSNPGAPYPIPDGILGSGSAGDAVKWVQVCLNELMDAGITVDGIYGNQTVTAVKAFQKKYGLTPDGMVGTKTCNKMLDLWRKNGASNSAKQTGKGNSSGNDQSVPSVSKVSKFRAVAKRKGFLLRWKKKTSVSGYQMQLSTKKNFKSAKTYRVGKAKAKYTVSSLKNRKKYYIRIRAYRTYQNSKGKSKKAYGTYVTIHKKTK